MKQIFILFAFAFLISLTAFGQTQKATTDNGKKVILNSDGTWKYADTVKTAKTVQANFDPNVCSNWIKTTEDKVSGKSYTTLKDYLIVSQDGGVKGLGIDLMLSGESIILSIKASGASGCIDKGAKINILFIDGSRLELASEGDFNCKGRATVYFGEVFGKQKQLSELKTKKIDVMRVWTSDGYVEEKFDNEQSDQFKNGLNCLTR